MERKCETCKQVLPIERFTRDKSRYLGHAYRCLPCDNARKAAYDKTPKGRLTKNTHAKLSHQRHIKKHKVNAQLREAVYSGRIEKPETCSRCGAGGRIEGHHEDYSKPFDVVWLCRLCHRFIHGRIRDPRLLSTLSNLEGDLGSSHMQGTPKAQGHEADNLSAESAGKE